MVKYSVEIREITKTYLDEIWNLRQNIMNELKSTSAIQKLGSFAPWYLLEHSKEDLQNLRHFGAIRRSQIISVASFGDIKENKDAYEILKDKGKKMVLGRLFCTLENYRNSDIMRHVHYVAENQYADEGVEYLAGVVMEPYTLSRQMMKSFGYKEEGEYSYKLPNGDNVNKIVYGKEITGR